MVMMTHFVDSVVPSESPSEYCITGLVIQHRKGFVREGMYSLASFYVGGGEALS